MSKRAFVLVREAPVYRREAFTSGLKACGYDVRLSYPHDAKPGDVMVQWNRYHSNHEIAVLFEKAGGTVIIAENGFVGVDRADRQIYALAKHFHNGRGVWPTGDSTRWDRLGVTLQPWRAGNHVLVSANRSFGTPGGIMPCDWMIQVRDKLKKLTQRPVVFRAHPGNDKPKRPFSADLDGAHCVIIWSSSTGCEALIAGVPVFAMAPWWICKHSALDDVQLIEEPLRDDDRRLAAFHRLAHAQYSVSEIQSGEAFRALLA